MAILEGYYCTPAFNFGNLGVVCCMVTAWLQHDYCTSTAWLQPQISAVTVQARQQGGSLGSNEPPF